MEWPFKDSVTAPTMWQCLVGLGDVFQDALRALNQCTVYGGVTPIAES